jgi:hypothetical protein
MPVCYFATHDYYDRCRQAYHSANWPERNGAVAWSAFGTLTVLVTGALELIATGIALCFATINYTLFLLRGIRALRSTGSCVRPAVSLAVIGQL